MSRRSAARGSEAARSVRLALRTSSIVAVSSARPSRWLLCCRGSRRPMSSPIAAATVTIPPTTSVDLVPAGRAGPYRWPTVAAQEVMGGKVLSLTTHQFLSDRAGSARRVAFRGPGVGGRVAGGIATVAAAIAEDMRGRVPGQHRKQREGLALLTATMLDVRGADLTALAAAGGRAAGHAPPVDRPALGQPADRRGRGDGALRPRAPGPPGRGRPHGRAGGRPDAGDRAAPGGRGGGAGR